MKMLKKLALVSAVSMISAGAFAMEAMDEEAMSATTGQDGITILIAPGFKTGAELTTLGVGVDSLNAIDVAGGVVSNGTTKDLGTNDAFRGLSITQVVVHDDDGVAASVGVLDNSGALVIGDGGADDSTVLLMNESDKITITVDMVGDSDAAANDQPMLNVAIATPKLALKLGTIYVADSNAVAGATVTTDTDGTKHDTPVEIMSGMEVVLGAMTTTIQLGNETQGGMIDINATITGGLTINDFAVNDANSGGSIAASSLKMDDAGAGTDLTAKVLINAVSTANATAGLGEGLYVTITQLGTLANGIDLSLNDVYLGDTALTSINTANLGDVQMIGLNLAETVLVIRGH